MKVPNIFDLFVKSESARIGRDNDGCYLCGRRLGKHPKMIHHDVYGNLIKDGVDELEDPSKDQGCFPVGSECAKKIPNEYLSKWIF